MLCTDLQTGRTAEGVDRCEVRSGADAQSQQSWSAQQHDMSTGMQIGFERISDETIDQLIAEGTVFYCAGGLMVEHPLVEPRITYMHGVPVSLGSLSTYCLMGSATSGQIVAALAGDVDGVMGLSKRLLMRLLGDLLEPSSLHISEPSKPAS